VSILRYSYIVDDFYGIKLSREKLSLIDAHFLAASHHYFRRNSDELEISRHHDDLFWRHLAAMKKIISRGDFTKAFDNTRRGLNESKGWLGPEMPDPEMFLDMLPDVRYQPGDPHPYDQLLDQPKTPISHIQLELGIA
jgi:hypothetical protein